MSGQAEKPATVPRALVITGVSTGIGHATAKLAGSQSWRVFGCVRKDADAAQLKEFGAGFTSLMFDVREEAAIAEAANAVGATLEPRTLNGLVNNAGIGLAGPSASAIGRVARCAEGFLDRTGSCVEAGFRSAFEGRQGVTGKTPPSTVVPC